MRLLRSNVTAIVILLFLTIMGALFFLRFFAGPQALDMRLFFANAPLLLSFFSPALTMALFAQERSSRSLEWLQSLPISSFQLVLAKFLAVCTLLFFVLLFTVSYPLSLAQLGSLDWGPIIGAYIALLLLAASFAAIGLWTSSLSNDQVIAVLLGFFLCFSLSYIDRLAPESGWLASLLHGLSATRHFQNFARGIIDFRDILYMVSIIFVALTATTLQLAATRYPKTKLARKKGESKLRPYTRKQFYLQTAVLLAILGLLLIVANALFNQYGHLRWDLTKEGRYSLSSTSKSAVDKLNSRLQVKVFYSPDLPETEQQVSRRLRDTLEEYAAYSDLFSYEFIEPRNEADESAAQGFGLRKLAISQKDRDQIAVRRIFKGMVLMHAGKAEVVPEIRASDMPEYLITKSILNLSSEKPKIIGVLNGYGGMGEQEIFLDSSRELFNEVYGNLIELQSVNVNEDCSLSKPVDALLILNIQKKLDACAKYAIDQAIMHNSALAVYQSPSAGDPFQPDQPRIPVDAGLNTLLNSYGFKLNSDLVLDRVNNLVGKQITQDGAVSVSLPALPILSRIHKQSSITQNLRALVFPFTGSIEIDPELHDTPTLELIELVQSSDDAVARPAGGDISVESLNRTRPDEVAGPFTLALAAKLPLKSHFAKTEKPRTAKSDAFIAQNDAARLLLVSCGDFLFSQQHIGYSDELARYGVHFFVNSMDWLAQDEALTEIRNRELPTLLTKIDEKTKNNIIRLNIFAVPALVLCIILSIRLLDFLRRRRIRKQYVRTEKTA
ncbi:MAG: Gldg family protein [Bradymonadia bacterium]